MGREGGEERREGKERDGGETSVYNPQTGGARNVVFPLEYVVGPAYWLPPLRKALDVDYESNIWERGQGEAKVLNWRTWLALLL